MTYSVNYCIRHIIHDTILWLGITSDEERLQVLGDLSEDDLDSSHPSPEQQLSLRIGCLARTSSLLYLHVALAWGTSLQSLFIFCFLCFSSSSISLSLIKRKGSQSAVLSKKKNYVIVTKSLDIMKKATNGEIVRSKTTRFSTTFFIFVIHARKGVLTYVHFRCMDVFVLFRKRIWA